MARLERTQIVPRPRSEVFAFFSDAANLEALTPPFLKFQIKTSLPIAMGTGTLIDYQLRLHGIPIKWRTLIEAWEPETRFVDLQLKGPYRLWRHTHTFADHPQGTEISDVVDYALPLAPLSSIAHPLIKRQLKTIFDYREQVVAQRFGGGAGYRGQPGIDRVS